MLSEDLLANATWSELSGVVRWSIKIRGICRNPTYWSLPVFTERPVQLTWTKAVISTLLTSPRNSMQEGRYRYFTVRHLAHPRSAPDFGATLQVSTCTVRSGHITYSRLRQPTNIKVRSKIRLCLECAPSCNTVKTNLLKRR